MLEILVHLQYWQGKLPQTYDLLRVEVTETQAIKQLNPSFEPEWKELPVFTRQLGDDWLASVATPLARVPSAIVPHTWNYLLNPEHPEARQSRIAEVIKERFDNRLFHFGQR
jgi:RES domain-containing protein